MISLAGILAQAGMFALTAASVGVHLPFAVWLILAPLTRLVALVPVSVMDFGLIQGAHVWLLALFDVPRHRRSRFRRCSRSRARSCTRLREA